MRNLASSALGLHQKQRNKLIQDMRGQQSKKKVTLDWCRRIKLLAALKSILTSMLVSRRKVLRVILACEWIHLCHMSQERDQVEVILAAPKAQINRERKKSKR